MAGYRVLLIAGGGTLGSYTALELLKRGFLVDVVDQNEFISVIRGLNFIKANVTDSVIRELLQAHRYDAIIDFIHYPDYQMCVNRAKYLMTHCEQFVFLSSYRVYANEEHPIRETSPLLLDVIKDEYFLANETYAIPKARAERSLVTLKQKNWTIIRPLISFSHFRLDLVTLGAHTLLDRAAKGKPIILPEQARNVTAGIGWAGNVGKMIACLVMNENAIGEAFTLGSGENHTWDVIARMYTRHIGAEFLWIDTESFLTYSSDNGYMSRCILLYDRLYNREIDNNKVLNATGLSSNDFVSVEDALVTELTAISWNSTLLHRFETDHAIMISNKMDCFFKQAKI
ncbi:MAG: NAD-dependent epimerase/dehydratase family protein [Christensenellales bacterium]|jgi:nucleoside-diphosphate-sugar epimerase